jgi:hypothetical protein
MGLPNRFCANRGHVKGARELVEINDGFDRR